MKTRERLFTRTIEITNQLTGEVPFARGWILIHPEGKLKYIPKNTGMHGYVLEMSAYCVPCRFVQVVYDSNCCTLKFILLGYGNDSHDDDKDYEVGSKCRPKKLRNKRTLYD